MSLRCYQRTERMKNPPEVTTLQMLRRALHIRRLVMHALHDMGCKIIKNGELLEISIEKCSHTQRFTQMYIKRLSWTAVAIVQIRILLAFIDWCYPLILVLNVGICRCCCKKIASASEFYR